MMLRNYRYTLLISSLPRHPNDLLSSKQPPLSRIQLDNRLVLLAPEDRKLLDQIEEIICWSHARDADTESIITQDLAALAKINSQSLQEIIQFRLTTRTLMAALRLRNSGFRPGPNQAFVGFGSLPQKINKHWDQDYFGISLLDFPWLPQAKRLLEQRAALKLESLLLDLSWQFYAKLNNYHLFNFEAVVIYVLRWDVINRWSHYNRDFFKDTALENFKTLASKEFDRALTATAAI